MDEEKSQFVTILVEGNIGCGKSTLLDYFHQKPQCEVLSEPVDKWKQLNGHNILDLMYKDPKRWSFMFQSYAQMTMLCNHTRATVNPIQLIERSIYSGRWCFAESLRKSGLMTPVEFDILRKTYDELHMRSNCDLVIYLQCRPEVCLERIKRRNRDEEAAVSLDYLTQLHDFHERWLIEQTHGYVPAPVLTIDANDDISLLTGQYDKLYQEWLNKLTPGTESGGK